MLCRRSASLIRRTRTSSAIASSSLRRFSACLASRDTSSSRFNLVRPSTSAPISCPNTLIDFAAGGLGILDGVVQQRRDDGGVVELEVGEDGCDFERMREIGIAGCAGLRAVRLHGVDIGAVQQIFVGVRIVGPDAFDQIVLPHHARARRLGRLAPVARDDGATATELVAACICPGLRRQYAIGSCPHMRVSNAARFTYNCLVLVPERSSTLPGRGNARFRTSERSLTPNRQSFDQIEGSLRGV